MKDKQRIKWVLKECQHAASGRRRRAASAKAQPVMGCGEPRAGAATRGPRQAPRSNAGAWRGRRRGVWWGSATGRGPPLAAGSPKLGRRRQTEKEVGRGGGQEHYCLFLLVFFFLIFFFHLIPSKQTMLHSRGKRLFHFKITRAKSQSLKRRGKITIML